MGVRVVHLDMRKMCKKLVITILEVKNADRRVLLEICLKLLVKTRMVFLLCGINFDRYSLTLECS